MEAYMRDHMHLQMEHLRVHCSGLHSPLYYFLVGRWLPSTIVKQLEALDTALGRLTAVETGAALRLIVKLAPSVNSLSISWQRMETVTSLEYFTLNSIGFAWSALHFFSLGLEITNYTYVIPHFT